MTYLLILPDFWLSLQDGDRSATLQADPRLYTGSTINLCIDAGLPHPNPDVRRSARLAAKRVRKEEAGAAEAAAAIAAVPARVQQTAQGCQATMADLPVPQTSHASGTQQQAKQQHVLQLSYTRSGLPIFLVLREDEPWRHARWEQELEPQLMQEYVQYIEATRGAFSMDESDLQREPGPGESCVSEGLNDFVSILGSGL